MIPKEQRSYDDIMLGNHYRCPLCKSITVKKEFNDILRCYKCGLIFAEDISINPVKIYNERYFKGEVYRDYVKEGEYRLKLFKEKLSIIKRYLPEHGKVLDVGCATGFFLKVMRERGYEVYGVEISKYAADYARQVLRLNVFQGDILDIHFPSEFFDIITMWDVLEHLPNPFATLTYLHKIIRKGGILIIETLNTSSSLVRLLGREWPLFRPPYHLFYFNKNLLKMILKETGFEIIEIAPIQTYIKVYNEFRPLRYFRFKYFCPLLYEVLGGIFDDVVLIIARKSYQ